MKIIFEYIIIWQILTFDPAMIYSKDHRKERKETLQELREKMTNEM